MRQLGEGFHTLCSPPQPMWDITIHPPSGLSVLARTRSFLDVRLLPNLPPYGRPASLQAHCLVSTPLRRITRRLTHRSVSGYDTICNDPGPPLSDIVLFRVFLSGLSSLGFSFQASLKGPPLSDIVLFRVFLSGLSSLGFSFQAPLKGLKRVVRGKFPHSGCFVLLPKDITILILSVEIIFIGDLFLEIFILLV